MTVTIVYDNNRYTPAGLDTLRTSWGFACWVETDEMVILFDTGGDGSTLLHNLAELGLDPSAIDAVVLSHAHADHTGGLGALLGAGVKPTVYVPAAFPDGFKADVRSLTDVVEVGGSSPVAAGVWTTGEVGTGIVEQALVLDTDEGLIVITGCAHPGVVEMVRRARRQNDDAVALVVGGFHLGGASTARIEGIVAEFRELGVERLAPCHCTGDQARRMFKESFGEACTLAGVGWSSQFVLNPSRR